MDPRIRVSQLLLIALVVCSVCIVGGAFVWIKFAGPTMGHTTPRHVVLPPTTETGLDSVLALEIRAAIASRWADQLYWESTHARTGVLTQLTTNSNGERCCLALVAESTREFGLLLAVRGFSGRELTVEAESDGQPVDAIVFDVLQEGDKRFGIVWIPTAQASRSQEDGGVALAFVSLPRHSIRGNSVVSVRALQDQEELGLVHFSMSAIKWRPNPTLQRYSAPLDEVRSLLSKVQSGADVKLSLLELRDTIAGCRPETDELAWLLAEADPQGEVFPPWFLQSLKVDGDSSP